MVLAIAITALLFAVPAFFLSLYIAVKISVTKEERRLGVSPSVAENTARTLSDLTYREMDPVTPDNFDFGFSEENF